MEHIGEKRIKSLLPTKNNWFGWSSLVLTILISIFWIGNTPLHSDDFYYQFMPGKDLQTSMWNACNDYITSLTQIPEAIRNHYLQINGRLSNYAYLAAQLLPYELIKYVNGIFLALVGFLFWRWCGKRSLENQTLAIAIAIPLLLWTGLQWNDQLQSSDFQFNYIISTVLLLGCLIKFFKEKPQPGVWGWILLILLALWHEGFAISFGFFLGVQWLFFRNKTNLLAIVILMIGVLIQFSPGTFERTLYSYGTHLHKIPSLTIVLSKGWLSFVAILLWLLRRSKVEKTQRKDIDCFGLGLLASWIPALIWCYFLSSAQRSHWPSDVLAIAFVILLIRTYRPWNVKLWLKLLLLLVYSAWGSSLIYWQCRIKDFTNYCVRELKNGNTVILDKNNLLAEDIPFWLMDMTDVQYSNHNQWVHRSMPFNITRGKEKTYIILSDTVFGKSFDKWPKVPGNNDMRFAAKNMLVRRHDGTNLMDKGVLLHFGSINRNVSPLDFGLGLLMGYSVNQAQKEMTFRWSDPFVYQGDTLDVIFLYDLPRTVSGRLITAVDTL